MHFFSSMIIFLFLRARDTTGLQCRTRPDTDACSRERSEDETWSFLPGTDEIKQLILCTAVRGQLENQFKWFSCGSFLQQWRKPLQRNCSASCRRREPVKCAWTSWCPSSSFPVVTWWFVVIVLPVCVTAPSAELSLGAAFELSCLEVESHPYTSF